MRLVINLVASFMLNAFNFHPLLGSDADTWDIEEKACPYISQKADQLLLPSIHGSFEMK